MRDFRLFSILDDESEREYLISAIHDEDGYRHVRRTLAANYDLGHREPNIQVWNVNLRGDRALTLRHTMHQGQPLEGKSAQEVLKHVARLWGFGVHLESHNAREELVQRWSVAGP
jgi:stage V sporulation protein R